MQGGAEVDRVQAAYGGRPGGLGQDLDGRIQGPAAPPVRRKTREEASAPAATAASASAWETWASHWL